jgi:hypothetical protein
MLLGLQKSMPEEASMVVSGSSELAQRARAIYEQNLRARLEASNRDDFVAIDPESGDFYLGKTLSEAIQASRAARPGVISFVLRVGHVAAIELGAALA